MGVERQTYIFPRMTGVLPEANANNAVQEAAPACVPSLSKARQEKEEEIHHDREQSVGTDSKTGVNRMVRQSHQDEMLQLLVESRMACTTAAPDIATWPELDHV